MRRYVVSPKRGNAAHVRQRSQKLCQEAGLVPVETAPRPPDTGDRIPVSQESGEVKLDRNQPLEDDQTREMKAAQHETMHPTGTRDEGAGDFRQKHKLHRQHHHKQKHPGNVKPQDKIGEASRTQNEKTEALPTSKILMQRKWRTRW